MEKLTIRHLDNIDKIDRIDVMNDEYRKICLWISKHYEEIDNKSNDINIPFNKFIININDKDNTLIYFNFNNNTVKYTIYYDLQQIENFNKIWMAYKLNMNCSFKELKEDYFYGNENENKRNLTIYLNPDYEKACEYEKIDYKKGIAEDCPIYTEILFYILIYSQLNQESVIRQTRTYTKKSQSKKDKRKGKKPKVKLIKQNIIRLNTDHLPTPTEEEKTHYERHTLGWTVRGHWRTYQSGKKVWIKPQIRGGKSKIEGKIYEI